MALPKGGSLLTPPFGGVPGLVLGLMVFQSSPATPGSLTASPSNASKTFLTESGWGPGVGVGTGLGMFTAAPSRLVVILPLAALVRGARTVAHVPMNKRANTNTPKIHFAKFGFLVIGSISLLQWFIGLKPGTREGSCLECS